MSRSPFTIRYRPIRRLTLVIVAFSTLSVQAIAAQSTRITLAAGIYVDPGASTESISGPAVLAGLGIRLGPRTSLQVDAIYARTDFDVGSDELHRHVAAALLGFRFDIGSDRTSAGLALAAGAYVEDDVSETDPAFRSSNRWHGTVAPGLVLTHHVADRFALSVLFRDYVTGVFDAIFDPSEGSLDHHLAAVAGISVALR